ncbi:uncharacterized protein YdaL [Scopulibacillus darangshiensis]|uniref:Uncharacterized protein YdaL n=1 Tax=Scopulibacillus darangshiensis TaxID=442528 RepID=A0A4R2P4A8_9BACL|nr:polysaccharide deacetylase family protein [Scopulibacillus darangshiensis]TCP28978.1 uncharacterized protein YdaL [Scopulibacillus darangshiensis]
MSLLGRLFIRKNIVPPVVIAIVLLFSCILFPFTGKAVSFAPENKKAHILVAYSTKDGKVNEKVRMLDMLLSHFSTHIVFKSANDVKQNDLSGITHLFYYGAVQTKLPQSFRTLGNNFKGSYTVIGANVGQLKDFDFVDATSQIPVNALMLSNGRQRSLPETELIYNTHVDPPAKILIKGVNTNGDHPLLVAKGSRYYFARSDLDDLFSLFLAEGLHHIFNEKTLAVHPAYLRLEDVHPMADPKKLMAVAKFLEKKHIPYMVAVIPVFKDPKTHKEYHYSDAPKVVKALKYMQENGGSIVMHGYTHQYRDSETGEGFEFWDVKNNAPISGDAGANEKTPNQQTFNNAKSYKLFLQKQKRFEGHYINQKLTKGIQELTAQGLYPLAFEAPHYTMSLEGYNIVSHYFSTYVGQIQTSNKDWHVMRTAPFVTRPSFLNGMLLLPETIGYVPEKEKNGVEMMMKNASGQLIVKDGIVAGFYHPYLGIDRLKKLVNQMAKIPDIKWIDLKKLDNKVLAANVTITSGSNGLHVQSTLLPHGDQLKSLGDKLQKATLLVVLTLVGLGIVLFIFGMVRNKVLDREKELHGRV